MNGDPEPPRDIQKQEKPGARPHPARAGGRVSGKGLDGALSQDNPEATLPFVDVDCRQQ